LDDLGENNPVSHKKRLKTGMLASKILDNKKPR